MDVAPLLRRQEGRGCIALRPQPVGFLPFFEAPVILNSDGFHYLQFSARRERTKAEQLFTLRLLPSALQVIRRSGAVQEYRKTLAPVGKRTQDGFVPMKEVEYWGFVAIVRRTAAHRSPINFYSICGGGAPEGGLAWFPLVFLR